MPHTLYLVRHGEAHDPDHVVYADLPGFPLSGRGRDQAEAAGRRLSSLSVDLIATSPLDRARETAFIIADATGVEPVLDSRLGEWSLASRWAGTPWADLDDRFPGELAAYLATPDDLPFSPESIREVAARMLAAVDDMLAAAGPASAVVVVSHQDPLQALRLTLLERPLSSLHDSPPKHAEVIEMVRGDAGWVERPRYSNS